MDKGEGPLQQHATTRTGEFDAVVVGAGPAGCMAARRLGDKMRVLVVDSSKLPRSKPCGGALNHYSWSFLRGFRPPKRLFLSPEEVKFRWVDFDTHVSRVTQLEFKNVSREAFDEWLLTLLPETVSVSPQTRFVAYEPNCKDVKVSLETSDGPLLVSTRYLIGADGALSPVRRQASGRDFATYSCIQDWLERPKSMPPYFDCLRMKGIGDGHAYTYAVPKGDAALVGSVFYPGATSQKKMHDKVMERLGLGPSMKRESAAALQVRSGRDVLLGTGNVLLTGEAAGFISPTSGEGISYALTTGDLCARAILADPGDALASYREIAKPAVRNIMAKTRKLALLEYRLGHAILAAMPLCVLSRLTKRL